MKNVALVLVFAMLAFIQIGNSQTEKGTLLLGGNASFQSVDDESLLQINPNIGYFIADKFAVGLNAGFASTEDVNIFNLGPSLRGYFVTSEKGSLFASAGFNYVRLSYDGDSDSDTGYGIGGGYAVFLNSSIALEISANYNKLGSGLGIASTEDGIFSVNVGFQIHFKK